MSLSLSRDGHCVLAENVELRYAEHLGGGIAIDQAGSLLPVAELIQSPVSSIHLTNIDCYRL
jgi:hypothetical protein